MISLLGPFGSAVAVAFQSTFHVKIHQNDIFFIFKKSFLISIHQNDLNALNKFHLKCKKKKLIWQNTGVTDHPNRGEDNILSLQGREREYRRWVINFTRFNKLDYFNNSINNHQNNINQI